MEKGGGEEVCDDNLYEIIIINPNIWERGGGVSLVKFGGVESRMKRYL